MSRDITDAERSAVEALMVCDLSELLERMTNGPLLHVGSSMPIGLCELFSAKAALKRENAGSMKRHWTRVELAIRACDVDGARKALERLETELELVRSARGAR